MSGVHFLHNVSLFANLSRAELEPLADALITRRYREGEEIFAQNSLGSSLFLVKSGRVGIVVDDADGHRQTLAEFGPGQAFGEFGLLDGLPRSAGAVALERSELQILPRADFFMYLERYPSVAINLVVLLTRRLRFVMQRTEDESDTSPVIQRMARLLADLGDRYGYVEGEDIQLPIRLTQGELAGMLGCPRATASDALRQLQDQGLIALRGLQMVLHDIPALRTLKVGSVSDAS